MDKKENQTLKRQLGLFAAFSIATGAMISTGIFVLPGYAFAQAGPAVILSYIIAGLMYMPAMFSYAELSTAMPKSGGGYFFVDRSMGSIMGVVGGLSEWFSLILKSAFALIGIGAFAVLLFPELTDLQMKLIAGSFCIVFTLLNLKGTKEAGHLQNIMVIAMLGIMVWYVVKGFQFTDVRHFSPFMPRGFGDVLVTSGVIFISFLGLTTITNVAEEIQDPGKNIPLAMFLAYSINLIIYILVVTVTIGVVPDEELSHSLIPLVLGARKTMGPVGEIFIIMSAVLAFATTGNAGIMASSRTPVAMSRDAHLPGFIKRIHPQNRTPYNAILITGGLMFLSIFMELKVFLQTATISILLLYILINMSVMVMRESRIYNYRPVFRSPFYPYIQIIGILSYGILLFNMGINAILTAMGIVLLGFIWYWIYTRIRINRESALIHVMERFMNTPYDRELVTQHLGEELKHILHERDKIVEDRFDRLVKDAEVMDLPDEETLETFLKKAGESLAKKLDQDEDELFKKLAEREKEAPSIVYPGLAIPRLLIEGKSRFAILIARSKKGISFSPAFHPAHTIIIFAGTPDMRPFYLHSIAAITEISLQTNFSQFWMHARTPEELRNIILMGERTRIHTVYCLHCQEETVYEEEVLNKIKVESTEEEDLMG